jgi:hypothetical protein
MNLDFTIGTQADHFGIAVQLYSTIGKSADSAVVRNDVTAMECYPGSVVQLQNTAAHFRNDPVVSGCGRYKSD